MSMKMVCNRCNKVKEDGEYFNRIRYISSNSHYENAEYDLCPECTKLFSIFIDGGEVEEDRYKDSKPCSVIIHKLANGNYGIESVPDDHEEKVMDKEESDLSVESHTNAAGVTVPDSEPWIPVGTGRIHHKRRKDCSNCRHSVTGDKSDLNYGPCRGDKTFHTAHECDSWERRPIIHEQSSET